MQTRRLSTRERRTHVERSAETKAALVEAAITTLCDRGYAGITTAEVSRRAGCTTGAMHHQFGTKGELMLAVLARLSTEFQDTYRELPPISSRSLAQRVAGVVDALARYYCSPRYLAVWELQVGTRSEPDLNQICVESRARATAGFRVVWLALFSDVKATRAELVAVMEFLLTHLRSFGIEKTLSVSRGSGAMHLEVLRDALQDRLKSYGVERVGKSTPR